MKESFACDSFAAHTFASGNWAGAGVGVGVPEPFEKYINVAGADDGNVYCDGAEESWVYLSGAREVQVVTK